MNTKQKKIMKKLKSFSSGLIHFMSIWFRMGIVVVVLTFIVNETNIMDSQFKIMFLSIGGLCYVVSSILNLKD